MVANSRWQADQDEEQDDCWVPLPHTGRTEYRDMLDAAVQHRLVDHLTDGGSLLLTGRLPQRDPENHPCTVLADVLGPQAGPLVHGTSRYYPSLTGHGLAQAFHRCGGADLRSDR
jgi:hypothetical protein